MLLVLFMMKVKGRGRSGGFEMGVNGQEIQKFKKQQQQNERRDQDGSNRFTQC